MVFATIAIAVGALIGTGQAAQADIYGDYTTSGLAIRRCANTSCWADGRGYPGQGVRIYYLVCGQTIQGWPYWAYHRNRTTGVTCYSADAYIRWDYGSAPVYC